MLPLQPHGPFPELTKHQHRFATLANGISVLLVSVPETKPEEGLVSSLAAAGSESSVQRLPLAPPPPAATATVPTTTTTTTERPSSVKPAERALGEEMGASLRSHLGQTSRTSLRQSYSGSIRSAASGSMRVAARRSSVQAYGYSLLEQSKRAEAQRKKLTLSRAAGCALSVSVGSFSDPRHAQGLAHLVEHVVFMGSDLFPVENDWDRFLSVIGGESNASTEVERTTYHFTCPQDYFEDALERFARFFIKPLLRQSSIDREMSAIDSEFNDSAGDIAFRTAQIKAFTARRSTPYSHFSCGNSVTLSDVPDLQDLVVHFFNSHYVSANMCVVLYSSDSLDAMQALAAARFSDIPTSRLVPNMYKLPKRFAAANFDAPFHIVDAEAVASGAVKPGEDGALLGCVMVTDPGFGYNNSLHLSWLLPSQRANFATKPLWYLANLIEDERDGSILHQTRLLGLTTDIVCSRDSTFSASQASHNSAFALWEITIVLTEQGLLHWRAVVSLVFEYLGTMRRAGPSRELFEELQQCLLANFCFQHNVDLSEMIESYAQRLSPVSGIPPAHVVNGDALVLAFAPEQISALLDALTPASACVELRTNLSGLRFNVPPHRNLRAKVFNALKGTRLVEPHYGSPFEICATPADCLEQWALALAHGLDGESLKCHAPEANEYVQRAFPLLAMSSVLPSRDIAGCDVELDVAVAGSRGGAACRKGAVACVCAAGEGEFALVVFADTGERRWMRFAGGKLNGRAFKIVARASGSVGSNGSSALQREFSPAFAPALLTSDEGLNFWFLQGGLFASVRVELCLTIKFPRALVRKPLSAALAELMLHLYSNTIISETYPALIAGTVLTLNLVGNQFRFVYSGFVDSVALLVDRTLPLFFGMTLHGTQHLPVVASLNAHIEGLKARLSSREQVFSKTLDEILCLDEHDVATKLKALRSVGSRNLAAFAKTVMRSASVTGLVFGNVDLMAARRLETSIRSMMRASKMGASKADMGKRRIMLVKTVTLTPQISGPCAAYIGNGPSSSVLVYLQMAADLPHGRLLCQLACQVLSNAIFHRFREELALAYHVSAWFSEVDGVNGLTIEVSSHHVGCLELLGHIDDFLLAFNDRLKKMTQPEFTQHVTTLAMQKLQKDLSPADEAHRHFATIMHFDFDGVYAWCVAFFGGWFCRPGGKER